MSIPWLAVTSRQSSVVWPMNVAIRLPRVDRASSAEYPSYSVNSACASSLSAISLACEALIAGKCDTTLARGAETLASPTMFAGLKKGGFLSPTGPCQPFQQNADGYCRAEGVGILVLKRLEDAVYDNNNIQAVIRGQGGTHSAHATSITHPSPDAQQRLFRKTLHQGGIGPASIGYVEMHGTGTQAGDFAEVTAVGNTFGERKTGNIPLIIGAMKANVGHAGATAGVTSIIKSIMILKTGIIPPQPGMPFTFNPHLSQVQSSGVLVADAVLAPNTEFDSIGVDSILDITTIDRFNELTNLHLGASFLAEAKNIAGMKVAFQNWSQATVIPSEQEETLARSPSSSCNTSPASTADSNLDGTTSDTSQHAAAVDIATADPTETPMHHQPVRTRQPLSSLSAADQPKSKAIRRANHVTLMSPPAISTISFYESKVLVPSNTSNFHHIPPSRIPTDVDRGCFAHDSLDESGHEGQGVRRWRRSGNDSLCKFKDIRGRRVCKPCHAPQRERGRGEEYRSRGRGLRQITCWARSMLGLRC